MADGVDAVWRGDVAYPGPVSLSQPGLGWVAIARGEGEMVPSASGYRERGEEFERVVLVGDGLGREVGLSGVALLAVDGAKA